MGIIADIKDIAKKSARAWDRAVDAAGPGYPCGSEERADATRTLALECDESYDEAIERLSCKYDGWQANARAYLEDARDLELEDGRGYSPAIEALELLAAHAAGDEDMTTMSEATYIMVGDEAFETNTDEQIAAAREALRDAGLAEAAGWRGRRGA